jgi:hypothetical protein
VVEAETIRCVMHLRANKGARALVPGTDAACALRCVAAHGQASGLILLFFSLLVLSCGMRVFWDDARLTALGRW